MHPQFRRDVRKAPKEAGEWAYAWIDSASASDATFESVIAGASTLKGGNFRAAYARKWRRKPPHRLVFRVAEDRAQFVSLSPRKDAYDVAARRIGGMEKLRVI